MSDLFGSCPTCGKIMILDDSAPTPEAAAAAPASDFDRLPWPEIIELIGGTVQRIQPGEVHFGFHGRDLIASNNGGEYNLMEVTRALDYSLPFGGGRYTGPTDAITLAERLAEALTPAPASPGEAAAGHAWWCAKANGGLTCGCGGAGEASDLREAGPSVQILIDGAESDLFAAREKMNVHSPGWDNVVAANRSLARLRAALVRAQAPKEADLKELLSRIREYGVSGCAWHAFKAPHRDEIDAALAGAVRGEKEGEGHGKD